MSLETQTHSNFLFKVSTDQYAGIANNAKKQAAKAAGVSAGNVRTTTVLQRDNALSRMFGVGAETLEIDGTEDLDKIEEGKWKGADAVTTMKTKRGKDLGEVTSTADAARSASVTLNTGKRAKPASYDFEVASLSSMLSAMSETPAVSPTTPTLGSSFGTSEVGSASVLESLMPEVFAAEEPISIFSTSTASTPSFESFVEAVTSSSSTADDFADGEFLSEMKAAMPGFFKMIAANDDGGMSFGGRNAGGYAQEAVTFAHEGLGVRRDVIDLRQGEAQERFMKVMNAISDYEGSSGHNDGSSFSFGLN